MNKSPYLPPTTELDQPASPGFDGDPLDNPRILVWVLRAISLLQIPLGLLGSLGAFALLTGDTKNPELYEVIVAPVYAWILSFPILLVSGWVYWKCRLGISRLDQTWWCLWSVLPTVALVVALLAVMTRF
ncbi:hypothetical protein [Rhodopirellula sp. P2]|uniref:hypothetical protein n=1 Tax=Rhodopirellula sp. P2 TaxID=2127060 RepID=UPI0023677E0B|nr:hypothetical protein [Rhodopirellula sp. P2]WDQ17665.1 hypothetical protein PSR62_03720 [Rhodopirellula sp. P2]